MNQTPADLNAEKVLRLINQLFPHRTVKDLTTLPGGLINTNLKVSFESNHDPVVLRLYRDGPDVCMKEQAIHKLVASDVPVPRILHAEPDGFEDLPAFSVLEFIPGLTFQQFKKTIDLTAIQQISYSVGKTLATIGKYRFPRSGRLIKDGITEGVRVGKAFIEGPNQMPRLLDRFLASPICQKRAGPLLIDRLHEFGWAWSPRIPDLNAKPTLVHSDFGNGNILISHEEGAWRVAAVLDWEFAFSGSPLLDVGHFLRCEVLAEPLREPHFSRGFVENGGELPEDWRQIVRVIDLTGLVECLTHENLPTKVETELLELITATLEDLKLATRT